MCVDNDEHKNFVIVNILFIMEFFQNRDVFFNFFGGKKADMVISFKTLIDFFFFF